MPPKKKKAIEKAKKPARGSSLAKHKLTLPDIVDISYSESLYNELSGKVKAGAKELTIDAGKVDRITSPCIQLIISISKTIEGAGGSLKIRKPSKAMQEAFSDFGLAEQLNQWSGK